MQTFLSFLGNAGVVAAVIALVEFLIKRHDEKKGKLNDIETKLDAVDKRFDGVDKRFDEVDKRLVKSEKDSLRTQLLVMISDYPDNVEGILAIGERYFGKLHGNWYATALFNQWLESRDIAKPEWFKEES